MEQEPSKKSGQMHLQKLRQPFGVEDIEWRLGATNADGTSGLALAYLTNRAIQERLDKTVGPLNWRNEFEKWSAKGVKCGISIRDKAEWITKYDGADEPGFESTKGGFSDSMKRAAVQWGIGRYLYDIPAVWVPVESGKIAPDTLKDLQRRYVKYLKNKFGRELSNSPDKPEPKL